MTERPALVLLDISMPKLNGWETCRLIREISNVPIIILTGRDDEIDKVRGLDLGADYYLTKPFGFIELQAHIRATLRRAEMPSVNRTSQQKTGIHQIGSLTVNVPMHTVTRKHTPDLFKPFMEWAIGLCCHRHGTRHPEMMPLLSTLEILDEAFPCQTWQYTCQRTTVVRRTTRCATQSSWGAASSPDEFAARHHVCRCYRYIPIATRSRYNCGYSTVSWSPYL